MRQIKEIIVHCSATREGQDIPVDTIKDWHVNGRGWSDIGYHFYIDIKGDIYKGRDISRIGAHCSGHNRNSIGICYCGGVDNDMQAEDNRTGYQIDSLLLLLNLLKNIFPKAKIHGHRDFSSKFCPSFDATFEYKDL